MRTNTGGGHRTARAHRHVAEIPAMYRVVGNEEWTHGLTTNISASGVLLQAAWPLALPRTHRDEVPDSRANRKLSRWPGDTPWGGGPLRAIDAHDSVSDRPPDSWRSTAWILHYATRSATIPRAAAETRRTRGH